MVRTAAGDATAEALIARWGHVQAWPGIDSNRPAHRRTRLWSAGISSLLAVAICSRREPDTSIAQVISLRDFPMSIYIDRMQMGLQPWEAVKAIATANRTTISTPAPGAI